jgi:hypothetical protein
MGLKLSFPLSHKSSPALFLVVLRDSSWFSLRRLWLIGFYSPLGLIAFPANGLPTEQA